VSKKKKKKKKKSLCVNYFILEIFVAVEFPELEIWCQKIYKDSEGYEIPDSRFWNLDLLSSIHRLLSDRVMFCGVIAEFVGSE
jgi:hypothetical protein